METYALPTLNAFVRIASTRVEPTATILCLGSDVATSSSS